MSFAIALFSQFLAQESHLIYALHIISDPTELSPLVDLQNRRPTVWISIKFVDLLVLGL